MKKYIGGFLELELFQGQGSRYHSGALALQNARACISHIISQTHMQCVWLPYYTCNALLEPFELAGVPYRFYALTQELELNLTNTPVTLASGDYLVYVNYFGLKNAYVQELVSRYGNQLLVDNTQDFFAQGYAQGWAFNSARKSFGVPDGAYLYGPKEQLGTTERYITNTSYTVQYLADRLRGAQQQAYDGFIAYEHTLNSEPLKISSFSAATLSQINYAEVARIRQVNYSRYHAALGGYNELPLNWQAVEKDFQTVPFCYPFLPRQEIARELLFLQNIFVPCLWRDVLTRQPAGFEWERDLTCRLLPLPLDHRYGAVEVDFVINHLLKLL